jgi:chaperonin cofactor prefoldin
VNSFIAVNFILKHCSNEGGSPGILLYIKNNISNIGKRLKLTLNNGILVNDGTTTDVFIKVLKTNDIEDSLNSSSNLKTLSANQGLIIKNMINELSEIGKNRGIVDNAFTSQESGNTTLNDIDNPKEGNYAYVRKDETNNNQTWRYDYADFDGDGNYNWTAIVNAGETPRNFNDNPIETNEISDNAITMDKLTESLQHIMEYVDTDGSVTNTITNKINNAVEPIDETIESINEEIETIDEEIETIDETIESINEEIETIDEEIETIDEEIETIDEEIETINETLDNKANTDGSNAIFDNLSEEAKDNITAFIDESIDNKANIDGSNIIKPDFQNNIIDDNLYKRITPDYINGISFNTPFTAPDNGLIVVGSSGSVSQSGYCSVTVNSAIIGFVVYERGYNQIPVKRGDLIILGGTMTAPSIRKFYPYYGGEE